MLKFNEVSFTSRDEWLRWRMKGCGASDSPILMGDSDYSTPLKLFDNKLQPFPKDMESNFATNKGNEAEPKIRSLVELTLGKSFTAVCLEAENRPVLISLDGRSKCKTEQLEIKLINRKDWEFAKKHQGFGLLDNDLIPKQYKAQVQHQLLTGAKCSWFAMYLFDAYKKNPLQLTLENLIILQIEPEPEYMAKILTTIDDFWALVKKRKPPVPSDKDYEILTGVAPWAKKWKAAKLKVEAAQKVLDEAREKLIEAAELKKHPRFLVAGLRMTQSSRAGSVDYSKIPELNGIDLEKYRKPGSVSWTIAPTTMGEKNGKQK